MLGCICDRTWEKVAFRAYNDYSVPASVVLQHLKAILWTNFFFLLSQWYQNLNNEAVFKVRIEYSVD